MALTKTVDITLLSLQSIATANVVISSERDVSGAYSMHVGIHFGRRATTALTNAILIRIEFSTKTSGDGYWFELPGSSFASATVAAESEAVSGAVGAGTNVITVASTNNLTIGDFVYIDNSTIANSEWGRIKSLVANTSITIEDNLVNAQTGSTIYDNAQIYALPLDLMGAKRIRVVADNSQGGQTVAVEVTATEVTGV